MSRHTIRNIVYALALNFSASNTSLAQSNAQSDAIVINASGYDWTALAIAPDGSWGVATEISTNQAITQAIINCKIMHKKEMGCGHQMTLVQAGWSLAIRCGGENIIVSDMNLAGAEQSAINRESELRQHYVPDMLPCTRVVTVNPHGAIVAPKVGYSDRIVPPTGLIPQQTLGLAQ
jgi:ribosomal protein RSM22 (predicted rRNA methylase)